MRDAIWIALAILGWGSWALFEKLAVRNMTPGMVQLTNAYVYSALAPVMYLVMKGKGSAFVWDSWGIFWTVAASAAAILANYAFLFAIEGSPVTSVMAWTQTYPALSFLLCWAFLGESMSTVKLIGAVMLVAGGVLMSR